MGKASSCIQLLELLFSRSKVVGVGELADSLETNPRNIIEYIRELKDLGYNIKSIPGRYGGYLLEKDRIFPTINLNNEEIEGCRAGYEYLLARNDFLEIENYKKAMLKIMPAIRDSKKVREFQLSNRFPLVMSQKDLGNRYYIIAECIDGKYVLEILYESLDATTKKRRIHPYTLFMYNNSWYVIAYDELTDEIRYFKLNRIISYLCTKDKFKILLSYNEKEYIDSYGMKQNGEWHFIKLKITGNYRVLIKERIYGKEQSVKELDDNSVILTCKMQNKSDIINFVLGLGTNCCVIKPNWLKDDLKKIINEIGEKYK